MFDTGTIIGIHAGSSGNGHSAKAANPDDKKEISEIIRIIGTIREKLDDLIIRYDAQDKDTAELDAAANALSDAVDSLDVEMDKYEE